MCRYHLLLNFEVNMVLNVHRNHKAYYGRGEEGCGGGGRGRLYTYRYTVITRMIPILRWARQPHVTKKRSVSIQTIWFICVGVSNVGGYKRNAWYSLSRDSSGSVWKSRWTSWAPVLNKPTVSVDVKQHFNKIWVVCPKLITIWARTKNCSLANSFRRLVV